MTESLSLPRPNAQYHLLWEAFLHPLATALSHLPGYFLHSVYSDLTFSPTFVDLLVLLSVFLRECESVATLSPAGNTVLST